MGDVGTDLGIIKAAETGDVRVIANGCGLWVESFGEEVNAQRV
jgi:hypothetical protein